MTRFSKLAAALAVAPVLAFSGSAALAADSNSGQIEMGNIYRVRNLTTNGSFDDSITASCNETVQFRVRIHNPGPDPITNVKVAATLDSGSSTSHSSKVSITADNVGGEVVTDTTGVNLDKAGTLSYVAGTTELLDPNGSKLNNLPEGITSGGTGVNIGTVGVSLQQIRLVQFQAKVNCPTPTPPQVSIACTELGVVKIDRTRFDFTVKSSVSNATVTSYVFTAKNAKGEVVDTNTVNTSASSAVYHFNQSEAGTYTVGAVVHTDKGNANGDNCVKQITVAAETTETPTTPTKETTLPNTGAGGVLGIFGGASALGAAGHYVSRRFRRG
jgi:uncharacterized repeat protein (TIGR01451 family)